MIRRVAVPPRSPDAANDNLAFDDGQPVRPTKRVSAVNLAVIAALTVLTWVPMGWAILAAH